MAPRAPMVARVTPVVFPVRPLIHRRIRRTGCYRWSIFSRLLTVAVQKTILNRDRRERILLLLCTGLVGKMPLAGIGRRFELVGAEDAQWLAGRGDFQDQRDSPLRSLKIGHANAMQTVPQFYGSVPPYGSMQTVIIDDHLIVDVKLRAIVGHHIKPVSAGFGDPEPSRI